MRHLELTNEEQQLLAEMLENSLPNLDVEIQRTDNFEFKDSLKHRRDVMKGLAEKVGAVEAARL